MGAKALMTDETGLKIVEAIHEKADMKERVSDLEKNKVDKSSIAQTTGTAEDKVMSQKAATEELEKKFDKSNVVQSKGDAEDKVMSQATATKEFAQLSEEIDDYSARDNIMLAYGKNLFNKTDIDQNTALASDGTTVSASGFITTNYIGVKQRSVAIKYARYIAEYDYKKDFINGTYAEQDESLSKVFVPTENTKYIKVTFSGVRIHTQQIEYNVECTEYEPYKIPTVKTENNTPLAIDLAKNKPNFVVKAGGKNLFDKVKIQANSRLSNLPLFLGGTTATDYYDTTEFIEVEPNTEITLGIMTDLFEYDENKNVIHQTYVTQGAQAAITYTFTTSANTSYIRVSAIKGQLETLQVERGANATEYEDFFYSVFVDGEKIYDLTGNYGGVQNIDLLSLDNYKKVIDTSEYQIWRANDLKNVLYAVHDDIAVRCINAYQIEISTTGINGEYDKVVYLNKTYFPNLIDGSGISSILILPFTRNMTYSQTGNEYRIVVITTLGQIYHNFPARSTTNDGVALDGDIVKFDESVIWDLPERKFPSMELSASGVEKYMPCLPAERYEYHPGVNVDNGFSNGGFGKSITKNGITYPRFYQPGRSARKNSFAFMGGYEPDRKISILGTYAFGDTDEVRICIFVTDDGGRSWYCKHEFTTQSASNITPINTNGIADVYTGNSIAVYKRNLVIPSEANKEPSKKFNWGSGVTVSSIAKGDKTVITTAEPHGLASKDVIIFKTVTSADGFAWMLNDSASETSGGNGVMFGVNVLTDTTFELYEYVNSAHNNIPARHVHHINRVKDGWLIGTGETYPEGFIYYMQMKQSDNYSVKHAYEDFPFIRLTSTANAVQRLLGAHLFDDENETMMVACDNEFTSRDSVTMPSDRTETFSRSSTGVFVGKLSDIDDMSAFNCVFEAQEVAYFFKEKCGVFVFCGQFGEVGFSFDNGNTWMKEHFRKAIEHFRGVSNKCIVIDDFVIIIK